MDFTNADTYWRLLENRRGRNDMSKGDTRAIISALADIIAVDSGVTDTRGLE